jgi:membrane protease YdiL (CAAX protease family)
LAASRQEGEAMNPFEDSPKPPEEIIAPTEPVATEPVVRILEPDSADAVVIHADELAPDSGMLPQVPQYPADLQITWSWAHFIIFVFFSFISLIIIQGFLALAVLPHDQKLTPKQMEQFLLSKPEFAIGSMLVWYAVVFFFLYVTLSLLRGHPFWECLGWRKIRAAGNGKERSPFVFLLGGCGLSVVVALLTSHMKTPDQMPVEELFKYRSTALLFMAMAVLVAPLVEETLFRGYLYPLFARSFGVTPSIVITGTLFGLMHGAQLGWTVSLVSVLIIVGIVFTIVRARTGSVFASYLMHLGYNSLIAVAAIVTTHGFTKLPANH